MEVKRRLPRNIDRPFVRGQSIFIQEEKIRLQQENPMLTKREIYQKLQEMWEKSGTETSNYYEFRAQELEKEERRDYEIRKSKEKIVKISPFSCFLEDKHKELKVTHPELTLSERVEVIKQLWKEAGAKTKERYANLSKKINRNIYRPDDEENMILVSPRRYLKKPKDVE